MFDVVNNAIHDFLIDGFNDLSSSLYEHGRVILNSYNAILNGYEGTIEYNGCVMRFLFRPAENIKIARTLVILHGHGANKSYSKFYDKNWNVIIPLDEFGYEGLGSWWLGENGDLNTFHLLQNLLKTLNSYFKFSSLYFWGSSMGGYGAILHGFLLNAFAIYAHIPQIKLKGTEYTDGVNSKFYNNILGGEKSEFYDLCEFIANRRVNKSPVLFLSQNSRDRKKYALQHFFPFLIACDQKGFAYSVTMPLIEGHKQHISVAQSVSTYFDYNYKNIKSWRVEGVIK